MSPLITPDFSESVENLTPGTYKARIVDAEVKTAKSGNTYVNWKLQVFGHDDTRYNGKIFFHRTMISGKGAGMLKQFIKAATGEEPTGQFDTDALLGRELVAVLKEGRDQQGNVTSFPEVATITRLSA